MSGIYVCGSNTSLYIIHYYIIDNKNLSVDPHVWDIIYEKDNKKFKESIDHWIWVRNMSGKEPDPKFKTYIYDDIDDYKKHNQQSEYNYVIGVDERFDGFTHKLTFKRFVFDEKAHDDFF